METSPSSVAGKNDFPPAACDCDYDVPVGQGKQKRGLRGIEWVILPLEGLLRVIKT